MSEHHTLGHKKVTFVGIKFELYLATLVENHSELREMLCKVIRWGGALSTSEIKASNRGPKVIWTTRFKEGGACLIPNVPLSQKCSLDMVSWVNGYLIVFIETIH